MAKAAQPKQARSAPRKSGPANPARPGRVQNLKPPVRVPVAELEFVKSISPEAVAAIQATKWSNFLVQLAAGSSVKGAAREADLPETVCYARKRNDADFALVWEEARAIGFARLEDIARKRAVHGVEEPVFYQGEQCGTVRKVSDQLLMFLLSANVDKYKKKQELTHKGGIAITIDEADARA